MSNDLCFFRSLASLFLSWDYVLLRSTQLEAFGMILGPLIIRGFFGMMCFTGVLLSHSKASFIFV